MRVISPRADPVVSARLVGTASAERRRLADGRIGSWGARHRPSRHLLTSQPSRFRYVVPLVGGSGQLVGQCQTMHSAEPAVEADVVVVAVEGPPERGVRRPRQWLVTVAPRLPDPDPPRRPVRGQVPPAALRHQQPAPDLERLPRPVLADRRGPDRPDRHVERHQLELEVLENARIHQHGRDVLVRGASHPPHASPKDDERTPTYTSEPSRRMAMASWLADPSDASLRRA